MLVNCCITKQLYNDPVSGFKILSCKPKNKPGGLVLSQYGTFTINGNNLSGLSINQEVELDIVSSYSPKYPESYKVIGLGAFKSNGEKIDVDPKQELNILCGLMTKNQAKSVNKAYPNFISMVLNGQEEQIDCKNIYGVGPVYLETYIKKVKQAYRYIMFIPIANKFGIEDINIVQKLANVYLSPDELNDDMELNPYHVCIDLLEMPFSRADKLILTNRPELIDCIERCEYACVHCLKKNEALGNTRISANELAQMVYAIAPETLNKIVTVVLTSEYIYYDKEHKQVSLKSTYEAEALIADNIKSRLNDSAITRMDWQDYVEVDGLKLTDEQQQILQVAQDNNVMILTGSAGCVDCDTEFFNGHTWKRIADYQNGDKVLQYNDDGTAELVEPLAYIKEPCDTLWHFETKYGVNQTICDNHNIVYWTKDNYKHTCNIQEVIDKQKNNGWYGYFETAFSYNGVGIDLSDIEIKLMCAVICDGSFYSYSPNNHTCRFHIKKDRKKEKLREIFQEYGKPYREVQSSAEGYTDFYIEAPRREKYFTSDWYNCSQHQLQIICDNIMFWDGSENYTAKGKRRLRFSANVKETADFVQFAFSACGYRAAISVRDRTGQQYFSCGKLYTRKSIEYNVTVTNRNRVGICNDCRASHKKTMPQQVPTTDGYKYCFTVPSHQLVLRRKNNIFITGNCGKSQSMKALIYMLEAHGYSYTMLCPTGTAAKVLSKATGRHASTIHMFLATEGECGDFLILEESSMIGVELLAMLLCSIPKETKIIFICDPSQLPSISCGNIVHDILESSKVPNVNLTKIFRYNSSGLITVATDTRMGNPSSFTNQYDDYKFIEESNNPVKQVVEEYNRLLSQGYNKSDILILSPYNKGNAGTYAINKAIQSKFNPNPLLDVSYKRDSATIQFAIGDRVINKKNNYSVHKMEMGAEGYEETKEVMFVANGSIGVILTEYREDDQACFAIQFEDGIGKFKGPEIANLLLGYAVSIHASQGNQARAVIVVTSKEHKRMINRNLLYVGFTRAQEHLIVIGNKEAIEEGMNVEETAIRNTWLKDMLIGGKQ